MSPRITRLGVAALTAALAFPAQAQDRRAQYRELKLADGREIIAEIVSTEANGLRLRTPQGEMMLSFELLADMSPADADTFKLQEAWYVYVAAPEAHRERITEAFRWIPSTRVQLAGDVVPGMQAPVAAAAAKCKLDFPCLLGATKDAPWMVVVSLDITKEGQIRGASGLNTGPTRVRLERPTHDPDALWALVHEALFLEFPEGSTPPESAFSADSGDGNGDPGPGPTGPRPGPGELTDSKLVALSFVPVPGLPAMKQKNGSGVAGALAITAAGTAAWVGAVGHTAQSAPELAGLSVVGFYATTVLANQITRKK